MRFRLLCIARVLCIASALGLMLGAQRCACGNARGQ